MTQAIETSQGAMTASDLRDRLIAQASDSDDFRERLVADPKAVLRDDYGIVVPESVRFHVHEDDATNAHLVLPRSKRLTEAELQGASGAWY